MVAEKKEWYSESMSSNSKKLLLENKKIIAIMSGATLEQGAQRVCGNSIPGNFQISVTEATLSKIF